MLLRIWEIVVLKKGLKYECFLRCRRQQQCKDFLASKRREMNEKVKIPPPPCRHGHLCILHRTCLPLMQKSGSNNSRDKKVDMEIQNAADLLRENCR